ncbi:hypothetical protein BU16DRAFT_125184 [Lophium mytilinum]|uniref:Uncharacterized protein n=1 Tax=Lophium mytilinum TaxID=390894 RepID=A0A6A6QHI9_9PEZI|nr:hypothetical protein BU16DRAFT_125184 [Lophium mytilinum]
MGCFSSKQASPVSEPVPMAKPINDADKDPIAKLLTPRRKSLPSPPRAQARLSKEEDPITNASPKPSSPITASKGKRAASPPSKTRPTGATTNYASTNDALLQSQLAAISTLDPPCDPPTHHQHHAPSVDPAPSSTSYSAEVHHLHPAAASTSHSNSHSASYGGGHSSYSGGHSSYSGGNHSSSYTSGGGGGDSGGYSSTSYSGGDSGGGGGGGGDSGGGGY